MTIETRRPLKPNTSSPPSATARATMSRLTIRDVAAAAGVSAATVSRALRGLAVVDPRTRDHIVAIARQLDYSVSLPASRLATGRTGTIGIVTPFVGRWYFTEVFAGIDERLRTHDMDLLILTAEEAAESGLPATARRMRRRVDGALVVGMSSRRSLQYLTTSEVPLVLLGAKYPGMASVTINDRSAARKAVEHLVGLGHQRIGLITGRRLPTPILPEHARLRGYLEVLARHDLPTSPELRVAGRFTSAGGLTAMRQLLDLAEPPTAVFVTSDEMAYGAIRALTMVGLRTGGDPAQGQIAIVGFDGHDLSDAFDLTTVAQPVRELGRQAAGLLLQRVSGGPGPEHVSITLETTLVIRGSTATPEKNVSRELLHE